ncbi:MAG: 3'-5' exonuclease [Desulfovibrio sp.]|nr:3'-5' exonuclease [Desulfovibrio sp.]
MATIIAFDFETSGYEPEYACSLGLVKIVDGKIGPSYYTLLRPPSSRVLFTEIHGLTWPMLRKAPTFAEAWGKIAAFGAGASFWLAHNASFDRKVLKACLAAASFPALKVPFLCTLKGSRKYLPQLPSKKLSALCAYFKVPLNHHHAASDALACAQIYLHLKRLGASEADLQLR